MYEARCTTDDGHAFTAPVLLFNHPEFKLRRQSLRNNAPLAERRLWQYLRNRQFAGYKFRRQQGIGKYIVDFYCSALRLVIEVDGDSHFDHSALWYDWKRQRWIEGHGMRVIRFRNDEIHTAIEDVLLRLYSVVESRARMLNHP